MMLTRSSFLHLMAGAGAMALLGPRLANAKEWKVIRVATEGTFPPFNGQAPDGKLVGFESDLLAELSKRMGIKCDLVVQAWDGMITGLTDGKYDAVMDAITITDKRLQVIDFSEPYTTITSGFVVLKDSELAKLPGTNQRVMLGDEAGTKAAVHALSALLKGKTVAVQTASIQDDFLKKYFAGIVTVRGYSSNADTFLDLTGERVDAVFAAWTNNADFVKQSKGAGVTPGYQFGGGVLGLGQAVAIRKNEPELKALFNKALADVKADGTLKSLSMKWFEADITV